MNCSHSHCSHLHPVDWDPLEDTAASSRTRHTLKSLEMRMIQRESAALPIFHSRTQFCERLQREKMIVVTAETGSGKSTQLPQYAAEYFPDGLIICTQPRVAAAMSLARRVADEYDGTMEGNSVGYQLGSRIGKNTRVQGRQIMFMTDTALIHESQSDPNLSHVRVLIVDEAHERTLNTDIVLGIAKLSLERRPDDFFVVVASATIDPTRFLRYFDRPSNPPLQVPGRVFPVTEDYLPPPQDCSEQQLIELHVIPTVLRLVPQYQGHTLVFLHGQREIEQALKLFHRDVPDGCVGLALYGSLSSEEQQKVLNFDDENSQRRMVVFCTNVAETSLTIRNTRLVIDTGLAKEARFDIRRRLTIIETVHVSKSSADQRKGRAGRTAPGHCVRLYNKSDLKRNNIEPEILRSSLDLVVLQLVRLSQNPRTFPFMDAPDAHVLESSLNLLTRLACIVDETTSTIRGQLFAELALDPRLSAFMVNTYTNVGGESLLNLTATMVAILSAPGSLFYMGGSNKEEKNEARGRVALGASEYDSDLLYLCTVYHQWKNAAIVHQANGACNTCQKIVPKRFDFCRSCRGQHAAAKGLNNKALQIIDSSSDLYKKTIMNGRWKLTPSAHTIADADTRDVIGEQLYQLYPEHLGHVLVKHLPNEGVRLINNEIRARISDTSVFVQRLHDHGHQHFVTMSITQLTNGDYIVDRLHPVPSRCVSPVPVKKLCCFDNVGWMIFDSLRKLMDEQTAEAWMKWLVYEYDRRTCRITLWGMESDQIISTSRFKSILTDARSTIENTSFPIECGPITASFKSGLVCSSVETMDNSLRIDLQHVPCSDWQQLLSWLQTRLGVNRQDIKENNFRACQVENETHDLNAGYEACPFYIVFKTSETWKKAMARVSPQYLCPKDTISSSSTVRTRMTEKDAWGRQLTITTTRSRESNTSEQIAQRLAPYLIDCQERGKKSRPIQPALRLSNLPLTFTESMVRQLIQPIQPMRVNVQRTNPDGTGSLAVHVFFNNEQDRQKARLIVQSTRWQHSTVITIRSKKSQNLLNKTVILTVDDLVPRDSPTQTFIITAVNRETAARLYTEIIPSLEPSWRVNSLSTVTVSQSDLFPNFDELIQTIATQFGAQVEQHLIEEKRKRCTFTHALPLKTASAATMLAQMTSPVIIQLTGDRQKRLFKELFDLALITDWCHQLNLNIIEKDKWGNVLEIRGPKIQQGQLMRQIADYSDQFDPRFRVLSLSTTMNNLLGRKKTASVRLDQIAEKWLTFGCALSYERKTSSIVIYAQPKASEAHMRSCEDEVTSMLTELTASDDVSLGSKRCVFCRQMSTSANVFRLCGHAYCRCASSILSQIFPLTCHEPTCQTPIHIQDLREIFPEHEEFAGICKRSLQTYLATHGNTADQLFCPNNECNGLIRRSAGYQQCFTCGCHACALCHIIDDDLHAGRTCAEREAIQREMGEFLPRLFQEGEKYARDNWSPKLPPIIRIDHNLLLIDKCPSLQRFYRALKTFGDLLPPDVTRGFFAFHGTAVDAIQSICSQGFDPTRRQGQVHGAGEYFGVTSEVSDGYSSRNSCDREVKNMLVAFILRCHQIRTVDGFCYVVNNPVDWSYAFNLPVLIISYGHQTTAPVIFPNLPNTTVQKENDRWHPPFRWHWLDDTHHFEPYTDTANVVLENLFEQYRSDGGKSCVTTEPIIRYVDDIPQTYEIDYINYLQTNTSTKHRRKIERRCVTSSKTNGWHFEDEQGGWTPYQSLIQDHIEQAYQSYAALLGPSTIDVQFPGRPEHYEINFRDGTQMNKRTAARKKIKRQ